MMPIQFDYAAPTSLQEAITLLRNNRHAVALAGGLSLLTDIKLGRISPSMLVDLRRIPDLQGIAREHRVVMLRVLRRSSTAVAHYTMLWSK
jgi:CO/xanthine dehydrogenase FAD-binding subunit